MNISDFVIPPQVKLALKFLPYAVIVGLFVTLLITRGTLADVRALNQVETDFRTVLMSELNSPSADRTVLLQTASARMQESKNRRDTLDRIGVDAEASKKRADKADAELKREQVENARKLAVAQRTINDLQGRKSTGNAEADLKAIEEDSKAAWQSWR